MTATKYRLICGILTTSLLASACSSPQSSTFSLDLNNFPDTPRLASNAPAPTKTVAREYTAPKATSPAPSYSSSSYSSSSSYTSSSDSGGGFGEFLGTLLGIGLSIFAMKAASDFVDDNYDTSGWTDAERKVGRQMTRTEHGEYHEEHPGTWTPVYIIPSK